MYDVEQRRELERAGLFDVKKPIWWIAESRGLAEFWRELRDLVTPNQAALSTDRIDRACERLIVESLLSEGRYATRGPEGPVREIRHHIEQHYLDDHDFVELARKHGLSSTHFRRLWNLLVGVPPARYLNELRLRQACRLLVESKASVAQIAEEMGFSDPLYFSRKFRTFTGENPTSYRKRYSAREL
jgi:AraC-like DNA-binding protein